MATVTQTTRKPKVRPADTCRLTLTIRGAAYSARPIRPESSDVIKAWRLSRLGGSTYVVADTIDGATCECADFVFRHEGQDQAGCKHVRACRAAGGGRRVGRRGCSNVPEAAGVGTIAHSP